MKILVGAAAATAALAIAAVPASFALTSGDSSPRPLDSVVTSSTTDTPDTTSTETPTTAPTRGWEVDHQNNGQHNGWENGHHAYGESVRSWAKCVSTQGKDNCGAKPEPYGKTKDQATPPANTATAPSVEPTETPASEPTEGD
jgi:hypothetical protein